jgi:hypothetical protein
MRPEKGVEALERFLFPDGDAEALADLLASLVGWQEREPMLAGLCCDHVRENFSLQRTVDWVERILEMAAAGD